MDDTIYNQLKNSLDNEIQQERFELLSIAGNNFLPEELLYLAKLETIPKLEDTYLTARGALNREEISHKKYAEYSTLLHAIQRDLESDNPNEQAFLKSLGQLKQSGVLDRYIELANKGGQEVDTQKQKDRLNKEAQGKKYKDAKSKALQQIPVTMIRRKYISDLLGYDPHFNALEDLEQRAYIKELVDDIDQLPEELAAALIEQKLAAQGYNAVRKNTEYMFDNLLYAKRRERYTRMFKHENYLYDLEIKHGATTYMIPYVKGEEIEYWDTLLGGTLNMRKSGNKWREGLVFTSVYADKMHQNSREKLIKFYEGQDPDQIKKALLIWTTMFSFYDKKQNENAIPSTKEERTYMLSHLVNPNGDINAAFDEFKALFKLRPEIFPPRAKWVLNSEAALDVSEVDVEDIEEEDALISEEDDLTDDEPKAQSLIDQMAIRRRVSRLIPKKELQRKKRIPVKGDPIIIKEEKELAEEEASLPKENTDLKSSPKIEAEKHRDSYNPKKVENGGFVVGKENLIWEENPLMSADVFYHPIDVQRMNREEDDVEIYKIGGLGEKLVLLRNAGDYDQAFNVMCSWLERYHYEANSGKTEEEYYFLAQGLIKQYLSSSYMLNASGEPFARVRDLCGIIHQNISNMRWASELKYSLYTLDNLNRLANARYHDRMRGFQLPNIYREGWGEDLEKFEFDKNDAPNFQEAVNKLRIVQYNSRVAQLLGDKKSRMDDLDREALGYADYIFLIPSDDQKQRNSQFGKMKSIDAEVLMRFDSNSEYLHQGNTYYMQYFDGQLPSRTEEIAESFNKKTGEYSVEDQVTNYAFELQTQIYKLEHYARLVAKGEEVDIPLDNLKENILRLQNLVETGAVVLKEERFERLALRSRLVTSLKLINYSSEENPADIERFEKTIKPQTAVALSILSKKLNRYNSGTRLTTYRGRNDKLDQYVYDLYTMLNQMGNTPIGEIFEIKEQYKDEKMELGRVIRSGGKRNSKTDGDIDLSKVQSQDNISPVQSNPIGSYSQKATFAVFNEGGLNVNKNLPEGMYKLRGEDVLWGNTPNVDIYELQNKAIRSRHIYDEDISDEVFKEFIADVRNSGRYDNGYDIAFGKLKSFSSEINKLDDRDFVHFACQYGLHYLRSEKILNDSDRDISLVLDLVKRSKTKDAGNKYVDILEDLERDLVKVNQFREIREMDQRQGFQLPNIYIGNDSNSTLETEDLRIRQVANIRKAMEEVRFIRDGNSIVDLDFNENERHTEYKEGVIDASTEKDYKKVNRLSGKLAVFGYEVVHSIRKGNGRFGLKDQTTIQFLNHQAEQYKLVAGFNELEQQEDKSLREAMKLLKDLIVRRQDAIEKEASKPFNPITARNVLRSRLVSTLKILRYSDLQNPADQEILRNIEEPTRKALQRLSEINVEMDYDPGDKYLIDLYAMVSEGPEEIFKQEIATNSEKKKKEKSEESTESEVVKEKKVKEKFQPRYEFKEVRKGVYALANEDILWQELPKLEYLPYEVNQIAKEMEVDTQFTMKDNPEWEAVFSQLTDLRNQGKNEEGLALLQNFVRLNSENQKSLTIEERAVYAYYFVLQTLSSELFFEKRMEDLVSAFHKLDEARTRIGDLKKLDRARQRIDDQKNEELDIKLASIHELLWQAHSYKVWRGLDHSDGFQLPNIYNLVDEPELFDENEVKELLDKSIHNVRVVRLGRDHSLREKDNDRMQTDMARLSLSSYKSQEKNLKTVFEGIERREKEINEAIEQGSTEINYIDKFDNDIFKLQAYLYELDQDIMLRTKEETDQYKKELIEKIRRLESDVYYLAASLKEPELLRFASRSRLVTNLKLLRHLDPKEYSQIKTKLDSDSFVAATRLHSRDATFNESEKLDGYLVELYKLALRYL
jgi:hypothetical protein